MKDNKNKNNGKAAKVKIKNPAVSENLSVILPMIGVFVLIVGGLTLLYFLNRHGGTPNESYKTAQALVKDKALIGLTLDECAGKIGEIALFDASDDWVFMAGGKTKKSGELILYELVIKNEDGLATKAILQRIE